MKQEGQLRQLKLRPDCQVQKEEKQVHVMVNRKAKSSDHFCQVLTEFWSLVLSEI